MLGGGLPPQSFVGLPLLLLVTPVLYAGLTGAFLVRVGALNESLRQQIAGWWSRASIRQKVLLLPGVFVLLSLFASLIGFQVGSSATRVRLLQQQLDLDAARVQAAVEAQDRALRESVVELTDPRIQRAAASPNDQAALRAAGELANELRVRYGLSQVVVSSGDAQPVLGVADPEVVGTPRGWARLDTGHAEHRALLTCPTGDAVRLVSLPIFPDALSASGAGSPPAVDSAGQPLPPGEMVDRRPVLIACAPLEGGSGAVFALLDPEYARARIDEQARLQSGLSFRFAQQEGIPPAPDGLATLGQTIFGQSLAIDLRLGVPVEVTLTASTRQLNEVIAVGFRAMLIASLVTLAALLIFGRWLARGFTRSLIRLTGAARAVTAGDLSQQVPVTSRDEIGDLAGAFNTMVAGLREREAAVRQREAAEAASRSKSMFLANMSHELRTPLNAILGFTQLMLRDRSLSADQRENLQVIGRSGEHLLALINDVLEMSKIEAGRVELREERFDLVRLLEDLDEMFQVRAAEKGLQLLVEPGPEVPRFVRADKGKLRQVLINLIGNAVKFTGEGGVTLRVGLRGTAEGGGLPRLLWEIEDTGPGMAPEEVSAIFEAFVQASSGRQAQEGTGLGLAISRQFVTLMGGELTVRSQLGHGSVFGFSLPVEVVDMVDEVAAPVDRVVGLAPGQQEYRILVVEDKWYNRHLLVKLLTSLGFGVREAANGEEGVAVWHAWQPHLIFMDMRMPVMDGYEATRTIKGSAGGAETVVVALTASAFEEERSRVADAGCDDFIRKPFRNEQLFAALERHLGVRFVREERGPEDSGQATVRSVGLVDLSGLPPDALAALRLAAEQADAEAVDAAMAPLADRHPELARAVAILVENFRFDVLLSAAAAAAKDHAMGAQP